MNATREYCLSKRKATEDSPDGWNATCMRLNNKIFAIVNHEEGEKAAITLKCDPELVLRVRDEYPETIIPGYHMNKVIGSSKQKTRKNIRTKNASLLNGGVFLSYKNVIKVR
ncbi:MmcQ/YjbR family DNA-binding protein [Bacillus cereus group sp. BfR-BA-01518]|uniref:MmcQ/YjbR family DNA-binding protein n=1 Tax=Bacillus cereus group sp. BfR-BA-01518 TaxID=2920368 RepID=UPI001F59BF2B|nr:MmcQ/YjbR family DNA-binding protein [Bacillus cereus group sp. BfR-BA-01518]